MALHEFWTRERGFSHERVDTGEESPTKNRTPILVPDGPWSARDIRHRFERASRNLDPRIREFIVRKLGEIA